MSANLSIRRSASVVSGFLGVVLSCEQVGAAPGGKQWEFATGGYVRSTPAVGSESTVYFGSGAGGFFAMNGVTGEQRWQLNTGSIVASPTLGPNNTVYIAEAESPTRNQRAQIYAVDAQTGTIKWSFPGTGNSQGP